MNAVGRQLSVVSGNLMMSREKKQGVKSDIQGFESDDC